MEMGAKISDKSRQNELYIRDKKWFTHFGPGQADQKIHSDF